MASASAVEAIQEFFDQQAIEDRGADTHDNRRTQRREAFHRPATIILSSGAEIQAYTRDLSRDGIGLVHRKPVETGRAEIVIQLTVACCVRVTADIIWCGPHQGNYASGARFLEGLPS